MDAGPADEAGGGIAGGGAGGGAPAPRHAAGTGKGIISFIFERSFNIEFQRIRRENRGLARFPDLDRPVFLFRFFTPRSPNPLESLKNAIGECRKFRITRIIVLARRPPVRFPENKRKYNGLAGVPPTPQAPAPGRPPSPAGFLRSLRFGRNDGKGLALRPNRRRADGAPHSRHFDRSPSPPGRGGAEKPGGRSVDAAASGVRPAPVAGRISPLASLRSK